MAEISMAVGTCFFWPNGLMPPTTKPVSFSALAGFIIAADFPPKALASFFIDTSLSEGTTTQTGLPSSSAISVFSTRDGCSPIASAACRPMRSAFGS